MIICKRPDPPDDHLQVARSSGWSFQRGRVLRMIICKRQDPQDGHLQEACSSKWSFASSWILRMIICKWPDPPDDHLKEAGSSATPTPTKATSILTSTGVTGLTGVTGVRVNVICETVEVILRVQWGQQTCLWDLTSNHYQLSPRSLWSLPIFQVTKRGNSALLKVVGCCKYKRISEASSNLQKIKHDKVRACQYFQNLRGLKIVKVAVEDIKTKVAHLMTRNFMPRKVHKLQILKVKKQKLFQAPYALLWHASMVVQPGWNLSLLESYVCRVCC